MSTESLSNWFQLPKELLVKPRPHVTFVGLNVEENTVHRNIWDRFTDFRRSEKLPVKYQLIQSLVENPVAKVDKKVINQKSAIGILKKNWIKKYLSVKTTVAVLFYQMDWTDLPLNEKINECTTYIKRQMSYIANSDIELIVVLIQSVQTLPADQNTVATDCISTICTKTNLTIKQFNILVLGDQLHGYIVRLESLFYDVCLNCFNQKIKKALSVIDSLKKSTQQLQFVHYSFKVAYFYEICQDSKNALKYYHQGYGSLLNVNHNLYNLSEIKTIASYFLYKMCKLMFELDLQKNAIHLFETHIDHFKSKSSWDFENHAWLSMQYKIFGNIFDDGIKSGLRTNQVQHPGFYYHYAAQRAQLRRAASQKFSEDDGVLTHISPDVIEKFNQIVFYGQMPWSTVPENVIFSAWVTQEKRFNHSLEIIGLFSKAADQFKIFNCNRMRKSIIVEMAEEYFYDGDYGQALTLFLHMIHDYQTEKWWPIISNLILKAYYCAFLTVSITDFLKLCLNALYSKILIAEEIKNEIYENFHSILLNKVPSCNFNSLGASVNMADNFTEKWAKSLQNFEVIQFDANDECFCINFKIQFIRTTFQTLDDIGVMLYIHYHLRNNHYALLQLRRIVVNVKIMNQTESHELSDRNIDLQSNSLTKISMNIPLKSRNSFKTDYCEIVAVDLVFGKPSERTLILKFNNRSNEKADLKHKHNRIFKNNEFDLIDNIFKTNIVPTISTNLSIRLLHNQPILIGEWYPIKIELINDESSKMTDFVFQFKCLDSNEDTVSLSIDQKTLLQSSTFEDRFDGLETRGTRNYEFFIKATHVGELSINITVLYHQSSNDNDNEVSFSKTEHEVISIVKPFELETKFSTPFFRNITRLYVDESFLMSIGIVSLSCHTLFVQKTEIETKLNVKLRNTLDNTCVYELVVTKDEVLKNIVYLKVVKESEHSYHLCDFKIFWKRFESENNELNMTVISLHGLPVEYVPLFIDVQLPPFGVLRQNIPITYNFYNKCDELIELKLDFIQNEAFLFSGYKKVKISILPNCKKSLNFNVYSMLTGKRTLPKLQLSNFADCVVPSSISEVKVVELCKRSLPSSIYITPKGSTLHNFSSSS